MSTAQPRGTKTPSRLWVGARRAGALVTGVLDLLDVLVFGLLVQGRRPALAIAFYDWDGFGVELWELVDGQLQVRGHESAI